MKYQWKSNLGRMEQQLYLLSKWQALAKAITNKYIITIYFNTDMGIISPLSQTSDYDSKDRIWTGLDRNIYLYSLIFPTHYWFTYHILIILSHTYNLTEFHIRAILSHSCHLMLLDAHASLYLLRLCPLVYLSSVSFK